MFLSLFSHAFLLTMELSSIVGNKIVYFGFDGDVTKSK